jgi:hypothetical protein
MMTAQNKMIRIVLILFMIALALALAAPLIFKTRVPGTTFTR